MLGLAAVVRPGAAHGEEGGAVSLVLHRAPRADLLADGWASCWPSRSPTRSPPRWSWCRREGVERWLTQRLSHRLGAGAAGGDGVCAGVRFLSPRSLVSLLLGAERDDPWDPDRLVWPLLEVIDDSLDEPWGATLARHLGHGVDGPQDELRRDRRWSVARRLAGLFASYAVQRPALVTDWREGRDTDGAGGELAADLAWQPELWRRLLDRVGRAAARRPPRRDRRRGCAPATPASPCRPGCRCSATPGCRSPRSSCWRAVGEDRDVHLWLPQAVRRCCGTRSRGARRPWCRAAGDDSADRVGHPLLASLGRDSRELQRAVLDGVGVEAPPAPPTARGARHPARLAAGRPPRQPRPRRVRAGRPGVLAAADRSLQVHACHGAGPPGRGAARGAGRAARGRPDAGAARHPRDVPRHRGLRAADRGRLRARGRRSRRGHPAHRLRVRLADRALVEHQPAAGPRRPGWSSSPAAGSPPARCSTSPRTDGAAAGSASTTTTSPG